PPSSTLFPYTTLFRSNIPLAWAYCSASMAFLASLTLCARAPVITKARDIPHIIAFFIILILFSLTYISLYRVAVHGNKFMGIRRSEEHTSELQSRENL